MAPYNRFRQNDPRLLEKAVFYFLCALHYGSSPWFRRAEDYAERIARADGFFNTSLFLHIFNVEVVMESDVVHAMLYHETAFLLNQN